MHKWANAGVRQNVWLMHKAFPWLIVALGSPLLLDTPSWPFSLDGAKDYFS